MNHQHDAEGRFTSLRKRIAFAWFVIRRWSTRATVAALLAVVGFHWTAAELKHPRTLEYIAPIVAAAEVKEDVASLSVEQLEAKLDAIVWGIESERHVMKDGETFQTFDPPISWSQEKVIERCLRTGGKVNDECYSYGPRQEKIPTIQLFWPKLHKGEPLTDREARDIAESNDGSHRFFLDCAEYIKGCADNWTSFANHKTEGQIYLDLIREAKGIEI